MEVLSHLLNPAALLGEFSLEHLLAHAPGEDWLKEVEMEKF